MITRAKIAAATLRSRIAKLNDARSIVGDELAEMLEKNEWEAMGFEARSDDGLDPAAIVIRAAHESDPVVSPTSLLIANDDYRQALQLFEPLFQVGIENVIQSNLDPDQVIAEAGRIATAAAPLKRQGTAIQGIVEAANLAKARLESTGRAVNEDELSRATTMILEYLRLTYFPHIGAQVERDIRGDDDGAGRFTAAKDRMLALIEPSVQAVPEETAARLPALVESVVTAIIEDAGAKNTGPEVARGGSEMVNRNLTPADIKGPTGPAGLTPGIAALVKATTIDAVPQAPRAAAPSPAPAAPVYRASAQDTAAPAPRALQSTNITPEQLSRIVTAALAPVYADVQALRSRMAVGRGTAPSRSPRADLILRSYKTGGELAEPKAGFTVRSLVRRSMGLGNEAADLGVKRMKPTDLIARQRETAKRYDPMQAEMAAAAAYRAYMAQQPNFSVYRSKYQPESSFATAAARDLFDESFAQPRGVAAPGVVLL